MQSITVGGSSEKDKTGNTQEGKSRVTGRQEAFTCKNI